VEEVDEEEVDGDVGAVCAHAVEAPRIDKPPTERAMAIGLSTCKMPAENGVLM
jgi:hypothetical protein